MLTLTIPETECYNHQTGEFITTKQVTIQLEHSLISLSKWESKWKKPFYSDKAKTKEEIADYYRCMCLTQNVDPLVFSVMPKSLASLIHDYMNDTMTATWFSEKDTKKNINGEAITSELIYYWMIADNIPFECQKWHLNRLLTLIKVCNIKNSPSKKMSQSDILRQNRQLNAARRAKSRKRG